jgi:hypothetical protein
MEESGQLQAPTVLIPRKMFHCPFYVDSGVVLDAVMKRKPLASAGS